MRTFSAVLLLFVAVSSARPAEAQPVAEDEPALEPQEGSQAPVPADALLLVTVNVAGATIVVDESTPVTAPASVLRTSAGVHTIQVSAEGYVASEQSVQVPSEGARVDVFLEPSEALASRLVASEDTYESSESSSVHTKWWFWAAIGGGVLVVAGVITAIAVAGGGGGQEVISVPPIPGGP